MNLRSFILLPALAATIAAGVYHYISVRTRSHLETERVRVSANAAEARQLYEETSRNVAAARSALHAVIASRANRPPSAPANKNDPSRPRATPDPKTKSQIVPPTPELRRMQIQAYVSEQRLRFGELLERLHFTPEKRQAFDRVHAAYQAAMLADAQTVGARQQLSQARDGQLQQLFGANYEHWLEANRNQPARAVVAQIVQQTFQSAGALTTAQADELTRIVAQHRIPPSKQSGAGMHYDWDKIINDAQALLADGQREAFTTAIEYRRTSEKMSAIAARSKR